MLSAVLHNWIDLKLGSLTPTNCFCGQNPELIELGLSVVTKEINNDELIAHCLLQQIRNLLVTVTLAKENYSSFHSTN